MDVIEEVAVAIAAAMSSLRAGGNARLVWNALSERDREKYMVAARDAIETYIGVVAIPLEDR